MKTMALKSRAILMMAVSAPLFLSCDLLDDADDVSFDTTLEQNIYAAESNPGTNVDYDEVITLDATTDPDINEYKEKIKGFKINSITYKVTSFDGTPGSTFSGTLAFGDASTSTSSVAATITNLDLSAALTSGTEFEVTIDQADVNEIQAMLKSDKAVKIYLDGTLSETPVYFTLHIILDVTVEADAL
jgi:hypothetical protein